jgi:chromosome segregation ATPase
MRTITTEKAERLADRLEKDAESPKGARYQPYTDRAMRDASTALRSLAAERDHLEKTAMRAAQRHEAAMARADRLQVENARLREGLRLGIDAVEFWAAYASPYFQDKHDLAEDLRKLRAALGETQ